MYTVKVGLFGGWGVAPDRPKAVAAFPAFVKALRLPLVECLSVLTRPSSWLGWSVAGVSTHAK